MSGNQKFYVQCLLTKGRIRQTAWIPEEFSTVGRVVKLKDQGEWGHGWQVSTAGIRLPEAYLRERSRDYVQTRKASDI